jgi:glycerone phosphate O-acyltransferase
MFVHELLWNEFVENGGRFIFMILSYFLILEAKCRFCCIQIGFWRTRVKMLDGFNDLVKEVREKGELAWVTEKKDFIINPNKQERTPEQIKTDVLKSDRLKHVVRSICAENDQLQEKTVLQEAKTILNEMGHAFDMKTVRFNGYLLMKIFTRIYKHIYYNNDLKSKLNSICKSNPVLFLPNHRSYMDFLLVSIICYHANIQMPMIATGQDFLSLSFVSELLRKSGAFFIRRTFGSDKLYWAIFHEYVQQHITNQDGPIEFFLEGSLIFKFGKTRTGLL